MHGRGEIDDAYALGNVERMQATQQRREPIDVVAQLRIALVPGRAQIARDQNAAAPGRNAEPRDRCLRVRPAEAPRLRCCRSICSSCADSSLMRTTTRSSSVRHEPAAIRQTVLDRLDADESAPTPRSSATAATCAGASSLDCITQRLLPGAVAPVRDARRSSRARRSRGRSRTATSWRADLA